MRALLTSLLAIAACCLLAVPVAAQDATCDLSLAGPAFAIGLER